MVALATFSENQTLLSFQHAHLIDSNPFGRTPSTTVIEPTPTPTKLASPCARVRDLTYQRTASARYKAPKAPRRTSTYQPWPASAAASKTGWCVVRSNVEPEPPVSQQTTPGSTSARRTEMNKQGQRLRQRPRAEGAGPSTPQSARPD